MRKSIAASVRISEIRDRLVELDAIETRSTEQNSEQTRSWPSGRRRNLSTAPRRTPKGKRSCILRDFNVLPETRERRAIRPRTGVADFYAAAAGGREVTGAAREYADACGVAPFGKLPLLIFTDGQPETRAISWDRPLKVSWNRPCRSCSSALPRSRLASSFRRMGLGPSRFHG